MTSQRSILRWNFTYKANRSISCTFHGYLLLRVTADKSKKEDETTGLNCRTVHLCLKNQTSLLLISSMGKFSSLWTSRTSCTDSERRHRKRLSLLQIWPKHTALLLKNSNSFIKLAQKFKRRKLTSRKRWRPFLRVILILRLKIIMTLTITVVLQPIATITKDGVLLNTGLLWKRSSAKICLFNWKRVNGLAKWLRKDKNSKLSLRNWRNQRNKRRKRINYKAI